MRHTRRRGFTLIELMVAIGILLVLGVMLISFLRGALSMTRVGTARGQQYETAQTVMRLAEEDFSQILGMPANPDGPIDDPAFLLMEDPYGRQVIAFTYFVPSITNSHETGSCVSLAISCVQSASKKRLSPAFIVIFRSLRWTVNVPERATMYSWTPFLCGGKAPVRPPGPSSL